MNRIRPECLFPETTDPLVAADGLVAGDSEEEDDEEEAEEEKEEKDEEEEDEDDEKEGYSE